MTFEIKNWKPLVRNTLCGFADVTMPSGMTIAEISIHSQGGKAWASPPSKPMIDRNGRVLRDDGGKIRYSPIITFPSRDLRNRWSDAVVEAVRAAHPKALDV